MASLLFGGGSSGPSSEEREQMRKDYWQTYSGWLKDEERRYAKQVGSAKARLAAGGISSRSEGWKNVMQQLEDEHQKTMAGFQQTETYKQLEDLRQKEISSLTPRRSRIYEENGTWYVREQGSWGQDSASRSQREATPAEIEKAKQQQTETAMSTEHWYAKRYGPGEVTPAEKEEMAQQAGPRGMVQRGEEHMYLAKQARSPFAGMG